MKAFQIVMKDNEKSEYYSNYTKQSWIDAGFDFSIYNAVVPEDLKKLNELIFCSYQKREIFLKRNLKVPMTDTEKACWYSHYFLWKKSIELNEEIVIIEHDSLLFEPNNIHFNENYGIIFYDLGAMGSYMIRPRFAKLLISYCKKGNISLGPYGFIDFVARDHGIKQRVVNTSHPEFKAASNQVMSKKYGNTIDHFTNNNKHLFPNSAFHKFIEID